MSTDFENINRIANGLVASFVIELRKQNNIDDVQQVLRHFVLLYIAITAEVSLELERLVQYRMPSDWFIDEVEHNFSKLIKEALNEKRNAELTKVGSS